MPSPWSLADYDAHEGIHFFEDKAAGLRAVIAIHSTHLGPSAGGARLAHYPQEEDAIVDALRLSRGMSYKNALAGLPVGGGKGVILAPPDLGKTPAMLRAFGDAIAALGGRYVTAEDVGMTESDMGVIAERTSHVSGRAVADGAAGGDPGPVTAYGVWLGIKAAAAEALGSDDMRGVRVAIQGVGSVGGGVARLLADEGAVLTLADRNPARALALADALGATAADAATILSTECDILSPNALGAVLNAETIPKIRARVVAGGANNQLATPADAARLFERGVLYAPDYVINAGGIINVMLAHLGETDGAAVTARVDEIPLRLRDIWTQSAARQLPPSTIADAMAQRAIGRG